MSYSYDDITQRLKTISGNSIIAWAVNYTLSHNEINDELIDTVVSQIKDQIHDNPELMQQVLSPENFQFFTNLSI